MAYTKYSLTPADNNAAPPNGATEGMLPSGVNDTMRDMMSQIRDVGDGIRDGTYTMTAPKITGGTITGVALSGNTLTNPVITGAAISTSTLTGNTLTSPIISGGTITNPVITGGSINNTPIGATTASTVKTTNLTVAGSTSGNISVVATAVAGTNTATFPAATGTVMVSGNMPAFSAYQSSAQTLSSNTWTKLQFQTEEFDTNNNFDSTTNYRFTPTVSGYYQVNVGVSIAETPTSLYVAIYKNGNVYKGNYLGVAGSIGTTLSALVYFNGTTDYVEGYAFFGAGQAVSTGTDFTYFQAAMIRSA
jgi:hypothetical protein